MNSFAILALCTLLTMPFQKQQPVELQLDAVVKPELISKEKTTQLCMTHPANMRPCIKQKIDGVDYLIAYEKETRKIKYITTYDKDFITDEGLEVGKYIEVTRAEVNRYGGWEIHGLADKDGWNPVVGFLDKVTIRKKGKETTIDIQQIWGSTPTARVAVKIIAFSKGGN